jgi:hypothetical protein
LVGGAEEEAFAIVRTDIYNYKLQKAFFGRTKPNCAIVSIAAQGGKLSQLSNEEGK